MNKQNLKRCAGVALLLMTSCLWTVLSAKGVSQDLAILRAKEISHVAYD